MCLENPYNIDIDLELDIDPSPAGGVSYGKNLIAPCSQVHDNSNMGVNRKILINLIYLFIQETYLTCANRL